MSDDHKENLESGWSYSDFGHLGLDVLGVVPGIGEPVDVANAIWYASEAKYLDAGLSLISIIPIVGDALGKGGRAIKHLGPKAVEKTLEAIRKLDVEKFLKPFRSNPKLAPHIDVILEALQKWQDDLVGKFSATKANEGCSVCKRNFVGKLKGKVIELPGVTIQKITYSKRSKADLKKLRNAFNNKHRKEFVQNLVTERGKRKRLKDAGLTDKDIVRMKAGYVPPGWQVHHKVPLDDGGTNTLSNLILIKNDPAHKIITNEQNKLVKGLLEGQTREIDFPIPDGFVYPPSPNSIQTLK